MLALPKLTQLLPPHRVHISEREPISTLSLADPHFNIPGPIDMLLGVDVYAQILAPGLQSLSNGLKLQATKLGWIIFGSTSVLTPPCDQARLTVTGLHTYLEDDSVLKRFWELESLPDTSDHPSPPDPCELHYVTNTTRLEDGRYQVKLPFRDKTPELGRSRHIALAAFIRMENRLTQSPTLYQKYQDCLSEYLTLGHMQPVSTPEQYTALDGSRRNYRCFYMPHHGVLKESSTTEMRVVFNASQKTDNGKSLNDTLHTGPSLQNDLFIVLLQWRLYFIAITADIAKMYRQVLIHPEDQAYQRILWRANPSIPIAEYELKTVTFGVTTAPYLALRTMKQIRIDEGEKYPLAAKLLEKNFYVDDYLGGGFEVSLTTEPINQLRSLLQRCGFHLRKSVSNKQEVLSSLPPEDKESLRKNRSLVPVIKTLGVGWNPIQDQLHINIPTFPNSRAITKRSILSWIAGLYDPLGLLAPVIIVCKIFMQKLWLAGLNWDDLINEPLASEWHSITTNCQLSHPVIIPRWLGFNPHSCMELHGFCDASKVAYAAVFYLHVTNSNGDNTCNLLLAKTRVSPTKPLTIPRLELCSAQLLVKLLQYLRGHLSALHLPFTLWTDSQVVLAWLRREPSSWTTFVANRVAFIQNHTTPEDWKYVNSADNPADIATRGLSTSQLLKCKRWWEGPTWLTTSTHPENPTLLIEDSVPEERRRGPVSCQVTIDASWIVQFSSLTRLLRVTAYILRFIHMLKPGAPPLSSSALSSAEISNAQRICVCSVQQASFSPELNALKKRHPLASKSPLLNLNPLIDGDGIHRVGGRLGNSDLSFPKKHPIILPSQHHFSTLVIRHAHAQTLHGDKNDSSLLRDTYWILHTRATVRKILYRCVTCFRHKRQSSEQLMADLPRERVTVARPFTYTGVDYAGPVLLKTVGARSTKTFKGYVAIFVCFTIKAYHLELVSNLSSNAFMAAFQRFIARRGLPSSIYSDCGTNFVGTRNMMERYKKEVIEFSATRGVNWSFIPPASPHFGGLWEAGVKLVKAHLKRVLGTTILSFEEYTTLLTQIEACLNSRPLCPISNDVRDYTALTPGHFLTGSNLLFPATPDYSDQPPNRLHRWHRIQQLFQIFWKRWSTDYLSRQQPRTKWKRVSPNLKENDVVLIRDERLAPLHWRMGRVTSIIVGADNLSRVAIIRTADGIIKRPITKLFKLPIENYARPSPGLHESGKPLV